MRKWMTVILAAGITISSLSAVSAENDGSAATQSGTVEISAAHKEKKPEGLYKGAAPFLTKKITLKNRAVYTPYTISGPIAQEMAEKGFPVSAAHDGAMPFGQLVAVSDEGAYSAFVINISFAETEESQKRIKPFFGKEPDVVSLAGIAAANLYLIGAEPMINQFITEGIRAHNKTGADKLPEDFAHVRLKDIEPIARLNGNTYTVGARIISDADGFRMPLYMRSYFMKKGDRYRVLVTITSDAERNYMKSPMEELMKTSFTL